MFLVAGGSPEPCWFFFDLNKKAIVRFDRKRSFRAQDCKQTTKSKGLERMANRGLFAAVTEHLYKGSSTENSKDARLRKGSENTRERLEAKQA